MDAFRLKITLDHTKPPIWRRVIVSKEITFFEFHHIIQIAMGWANYHLFEFNIAGYRIGTIDDEFGDMGFGQDQLVDCKTTKLKDILSGEKENFIYEYDFGDSWTHTVSVEKVLPGDTEAVLPLCLKGKFSCPPEDCGGIPGFDHLLKVLAGKKNKEYKELLQWSGGYSPNKFDLENINDQLNDLGEYIKEWSED